MSPGPRAIGQLLEQARLIVCCGSGGVGKTTTAAALALCAAEAGRRALVLTVDPARRLASCMGLDEIGWQPHRVELAGRQGELWAMMLDTRAMFDDLVERLAPNAQTVENITSSRLYSIFAGTMHGTPEYMALESLHNVYHDDRFELVVLDTPPLTNALDFFSVPQRASWMFDERVMRWFVADLRPRGLLGRLHPGAVVLKLMASLAGKALVDKLVEFFTALDVIRDALKQRGTEVAEILRAPETGYLVVTAAHERRIDEALTLARQLEELKQRVDAFVVNRSHASFAPAVRPSSADNELRTRLGALFDEVTDEALAGVRQAHAQMAASGRRHQHELERLTERVDAERVVRVPDYEQDIHDLDGLSRLGGQLVSHTRRDGAG